MTGLLLAPAALSLLVLGAHFLRAAQVPLLALTMAVLALLFVRRPWAARAPLVPRAGAVGRREWYVRRGP